MLITLLTQRHFRKQENQSSETKSKHLKSDSQLPKKLLFASMKAP